MNFSLEDLLQSTGGRCLNPKSLGNNLIKSVSIDTRTIQEGGLFVPIKGENFDGHDFILDAYKKGAKVTFTEKEEVKEPNLCYIYVKDTKKALGDLAHYYRLQFEIPFIAVTGSVGKTSTKDLIAAVLGAKYCVHKTEGNYNNDLGVPLTLLGLKKEHQISIVEMGMNHFGEISYLSKMVQPDQAVITNIGVSHIENLGSQEGILKAKLEIIDGLKGKGNLIVHGEDAYLKKVENACKITYGREKCHPYRALKIEKKEDVLQAILVSPKQKYTITLHAFGEHMIDNALVALILAEQYGLTEQEIVKGFLNYTPGKMRMQKKQAENGLTILDDAYNASPESMHAALRVLEGFQTKGQRIAVLGDMFEMGDFAPSLHKKVGSAASQMDIDRLCLIGDLAKYIGEGANGHSHLKIHYYKDKESFISNCQTFLKKDDVLLFKASRGMHFEQIVEAIGKVKFNEK